MNPDDFRIIKYHANLSRNFGYWVFVSDRRPQRESDGKRGRKRFIAYFESLFGPLGSRWNYSRDFHGFIIKLNDEKDLLLFLLKFKKY
jgi:hypothetical protein